MNIEMICHCGEHYWARKADLDRGWARSCDKSCAAKRRDFGRPAAKRADGAPLKMPRGKKKGAKRYTPDKRYAERDEQRWKVGGEYGDEWDYDEHPFSDEALGQWLD